MPRAGPDLTGQTIGKFRVLAPVDPDERGHRRYLVQCDCGSAPKVIRAYNLKRGDIKSCGCLVQEHLKKVKISYWRGHGRKERHGATDKSR
jgi:hypothetical protein